MTFFFQKITLFSAFIPTFSGAYLRIGDNPSQCKRKYNQFIKMFFIFLKKKLLFFGTRVVSEWKTYAVGGIRFLRRLLSGLRRGRMVRIGGLEPPLREELDPKSNAATNYATSAVCFRPKNQYLANNDRSRKRMQNYTFS